MIPIVHGLLVNQGTQIQDPDGFHPGPSRVKNYRSGSFVCGLVEHVTVDYSVDEG